MLPNMIKFGVLTHFVINQDFIAKVLCINKEKPIKACNGKCYLSKQLEETDPKEEKRLPFNKKERSEVLHYPANEKDHLKTLSLTHFTKRKPLRKNNLYSFYLIDRVFHPPKFTVATYS